MEYRTLGRTGLRVSAIGLGCVQIGSSRTKYATRIVRRALELGVTYFDVARGYGDAESKLGLGLEGRRQEVVVSTKTRARTRDDAWRDVNESLARLRTAYVDNYHLHGLRPGQDMDRRLGPGGALEALIEAREQGLIHHIGCSGHRSEVLIEAIQRFDFEVILVPMNIVEREPLDELIPLCREKGIAVTIMKPVATGLLPAGLALKWLLNQPIASAVPGATTLEELEENALVGQRDTTLSHGEQLRIQEIKGALEHVRCRICEACMPCPQEIPIATTLGTDVMYDHYRTMGPDRFRTFPWAPERIERDLPQRQKLIAAIDSCTRCGECEARCPYGLPVVELLQGAVPAMRDMVGIYGDLLSSARRIERSV
jgi:aryl-alcohol dehydrogenase-like predicted oxidoreductase